MCISGFEYSRSDNPTRNAMEEVAASLEGGSTAWRSPPVLAAETTIMQLLKPGDHVIAGDDLYGGTYRLFTACWRSTDCVHLSSTLQRDPAWPMPFDPRPA